MAEPRHAKQTSTQGIHTIIAYKFLDAADRTAFANEQSGNPCVSALPGPGDVGKVALQLDNGSFWLLIDDSPITWDRLDTAISLPNIKSGVLIPGAFSGNPKLATVTFSTAFPDTNYSVTLAPGTISKKSFAPTVESKATTGFDVNLGSNNLADLVEIGWHAIPNGEF
jgi:hypothetical protein